MTVTYTPCAGTGQPATGVRLMNGGCGSKYARLAGKNAGRCPTCDRSFTLGRGITVTPRHKGVTA